MLLKRLLLAVGVVLVVLVGLYAVERWISKVPPPKPPAEVAAPPAEEPAFTPAPGATPEGQPLVPPEVGREIVKQMMGKPMPESPGEAMKVLSQVMDGVYRNAKGRGIGEMAAQALAGNPKKRGEFEAFCKQADEQRKKVDDWYFDQRQRIQDMELSNRSEAEKAKAMVYLNLVFDGIHRQMCRGVRGG
ncbi:MAG: hypothetical protein HYY13_09790 [Nitrospirae bacterium]|nr:hypothetical protein [Nitrospirota bacterium]